VLVEFLDASLPRYELGSRKLSRIFRVGKLAVIKNEKKRIRLSEEDFMCDSNLQ
jgi:hypothetical protein